jgi:hypothetical protein
MDVTVLANGFLVKQAMIRPLFLCVRFLPCCGIDSSVTLLIHVCLCVLPYCQVILALPRSSPAELVVDRLASVMFITDGPFFFTVTWQCFALCLCACR